MTEEQKVFEEYPKADCNTCRSYMQDQCDGVPVGITRKCTSYVATRQSDIPKQIEKLNEDIIKLNLYGVILTIAVMLIAVRNLIV